MRDSQGRTALHRCALAGHPVVASILVECILLQWRAGVDCINIVKGSKPQFCTAEQRVEMEQQGAWPWLWAPAFVDNSGRLPLDYVTAVQDKLVVRAFWWPSLSSFYLQTLTSTGCRDAVQHIGFTSAHTRIVWQQQEEIVFGVFWNTPLHFLSLIVSIFSIEPYMCWITLHLWRRHPLVMSMVLLSVLVSICLPQCPAENPKAKTVCLHWRFCNFNNLLRVSLFPFIASGGFTNFTCCTNVKENLEWIPPWDQYLITNCSLHWARKTFEFLEQLSWNGKNCF